MFFVAAYLSDSHLTLAGLGCGADVFRDQFDRPPEIRLQNSLVKACSTASTTDRILPVSLADIALANDKPAIIVARVRMVLPVIARRLPVRAPGQLMFFSQNR